MDLWELGLVGSCGKDWNLEEMGHVKCCMEAYRRKYGKEIGGPCLYSKLELTGFIINSIS